MTTATAPAVDLHNVHVVVRGHGFFADGLQRERGEVVDTRGWRNVEPLLGRRDLAKPDYNLNETITQCSCGRLWENEERAVEHRCPARKESDI